MTQNKDLFLRSKEEKRILAGHLWIYSNEIDTKRSPLKSFQSGEIVCVRDSQGQALGLAYINPHTLMSARLLTRDAQAQINSDFFVKRFSQALSLRESVYDKPYYRLVYGESDFLPGLVIDRFNKSFVVQVNTAGMEALLTPILEALEQLFECDSIVIKADSAHRTYEQLPLYTRIEKGNEIFSLIENNTHFQTQVLSGQKTGWFYDHRDNRARLQTLAKDKKVLDLFSYIGGWGIEAAVAGAKEVLCIDSSQAALDLLMTNAKANNVDSKVQIRCADVFDALSDLKKAGESFDIIILDPPALIKKQKDLKAGLKAYHFLNQAACELLASQGILVSASCSMHLPYDDLKQIIRKVAKNLSKELRIFAQGHQAMDHPIHPAIPETDYLKALFVYNA